MTGEGLGSVPTSAYWASQQGQRLKLSPAVHFTPSQPSFFWTRLRKQTLSLCKMSLPSLSRESDLPKSTWSARSRLKSEWVSVSRLGSSGVQSVSQECTRTHGLGQVRTPGRWWVGTSQGVVLPPPPLPSTGPQDARQSIVGAEKGN